MSDDADGSPYKLVESLYGPGTVGAWVLTILSVIISWTVNKHHRCKDTLSIDLVTILLFPSVAAGHLMYQITRLNDPIALTLTSPAIKDMQLAAAIEAPLNICETFSMAALVLAIPCGPWWRRRSVNWKRLCAIIATGLLSWATENMLFFAATSKGVQASEIMLSRPYAFLFTPIIAGSWAFLVICIAVGLGAWAIVSWIRDQHERQSETTRAAAIPNPRADAAAIRLAQLERSGVGGQAGAVLENLRSSVEVEYAYFRTISSTSQEMNHLTSVAQKDAIAMRLVSLVTLIFLPASFSTTLLSTYIYSTKVETNSKEESLVKATRVMFFLPKSRESIGSIDQWLALTAGVFVLVYSALSAYESRRPRDPIKQRMVRRRQSI